MTTTNSKVPTLAELHKSPEEAFENDKLSSLLNEEPPVAWLKSHPLVKVKNNQGQEVPAKYLPIDKVEFLLTRIFQRWFPEVMSITETFNAVSVHVRLHYFNPYLKAAGEWSFIDGVGAVGCVNKEGNTSFTAVQMALPSAKTYALKDAAAGLGKLFGRDLNRRDTVTFVGSFFGTKEEGEKKEEQKETFDYPL